MSQFESHYLSMISAGDLEQLLRATSESSWGNHVDKPIQSNHRMESSRMGQVFTSTGKQIWRMQAEKGKPSSKHSDDKHGRLIKQSGDGLTHGCH